MGIDVVSAAAARSLEICGGSDGTIRRPGRRKFDPRAIALSANIEIVLAVAGLRASEQLKVVWPKFSAATYHRLVNAIPFLLGTLSFAAIFTSPGAIVLSTIAVLPTAFRLSIAARSRSGSKENLRRPIVPDTPDENLPVYSVIVPLRSEARMVDQLLSAIERLDYPPDRLDVIIAVEADCHDTRASITARNHRIPVTVVPVPPGEPRTKPKALSVALPLARGAYTVIYDAEDRPDPDQLRCAVRAFRTAGNDLACVQARLCIDTTTSWHARYFTAEYAAHFDFFLPILAASRLPLPLGGSSNHFRTRTLRDVGGWDPYNVTEDADLGMRLARFGYRCGVIDSTTYEEAPANIRRWLGQRSRWFKGWMQTWLVHMRSPFQLFRDLGFSGFITFQAIVGGNALVALAHVAFLFGAFWELGVLVFTDGSSAASLCLAYYLITAAYGYFVSAVFGWCGLRYRNVPQKTRTLAWTPIHWVLLSATAYWAAAELILSPFRWRKTEHGLDKTTWPNSTTRPLLTLERHLTELKRNGELPQIWNDLTDSAVNRQQHPRAAA
jgi:cellulose synthase/poly-beta-1,6-N-acetylglucosamine synthase-like glycosyltransferase